ncbi:hypothetical protein PGB90_006456 [Kerria lacca]
MRIYLFCSGSKDNCKITEMETRFLARDRQKNGKLAMHPRLHQETKSPVWVGQYENSSPIALALSRLLEMQHRDIEEDDFDATKLPRSASIDSIVEIKHCVNLVRKLPSPLLHRSPASPPPRPCSPNTARRLKSRRAISCFTYGKVEKNVSEKP